MNLYNKIDDDLKMINSKHTNAIENYMADTGNQLNANKIYQIKNLNSKI
jgi:hypothetical protein